MSTLVLICGYARAGKDTLAAGFLERYAVSKGPIVHVNFADTLKDAGNTYLAAVGMFKEGDRDFRQDSFKVRNRRFLVDAGTFARSLNRDVFAEAFAAKAKRWKEDLIEPLIVCSDWRYLNELRVQQAALPDWKIVTVRVDTVGVEAANEEEGMSIGEITREVPVDVSFKFMPNSAKLIKAEGKNLCRSFGY